MPKRPTPRAAATSEHHAHLAGRLTLRDRWLAQMLYEHKVLTTQQIVKLCYPTNHRMLDLFKWCVVDSFQPFVSSGTAPMHYVLDIAGAVALAYEDGLDLKQLGYRHESNGTYGTPRVHAELRNRGHRHSRKRVARLLRAAGRGGRTPKRSHHPRPRPGRERPRQI